MHPLPSTYLRVVAGITASALVSLTALACYAPATSVPVQPATLPAVQPAALPSPPPGQPAATSTTTPPLGNEPSTPLVVALTMDKAPRPGEEATIVLEITAYMDAPGTTARIELPPQAELASGALEWQGDVMVGSPARLAATVVFKAIGAYAIRGVALRPVDAGMTWGDAQDIFLTVREDGSFFGLEDAGAPELSASPAP